MSIEYDKREFERVFSLPRGFLDDRKNLLLPETCALFKLVEKMPWLVEVVDSGYDPVVAELVLQREIINHKIRQAKR